MSSFREWRWVGDSFRENIAKRWLQTLLHDWDWYIVLLYWPLFGLLVLRTEISFSSRIYPIWNASLLLEESEQWTWALYQFSMKSDITWHQLFVRSVELSTFSDFHRSFSLRCFPGNMLLSVLSGSKKLFEAKSEGWNQIAKGILWNRVKRYKKSDVAWSENSQNNVSSYSLNIVMYDRSDQPIW